MQTCKDLHDNLFEEIVMIRVMGMVFPGSLSGIHMKATKVFGYLNSYICDNS